MCFYLFIYFLYARNVFSDQQSKLFPYYCKMSYLVNAVFYYIEQRFKVINAKYCNNMALPYSTETFGCSNQAARCTV